MFVVLQTEMCMSKFKELEMKSIEALVVPSQLYLQNDYTGKNTVSKVIGQSGQSSFASRSDEGTKKADEMAQVPTWK